MKIYGIANNIYHNRNSETFDRKTSDANQTAYRASSRTDRLEISLKPYEADNGDKKLTATSGKDALGITRGSEEGSFVIHFSDSAMVSRAVSRGYLTVNGTKVELTDDIKKQLIQVDRQAQIDRERAFGEYIMQHELAVAEQQGEAYQKMSDGISQAFATAAKLSKGAKVSPAEERQLLEMNPQLYTMSKIVASMEKQLQKQDGEAIQMPKRDQEDDQATTGIDASSIELKSYETRLMVSLSDTVQLQDVSEGEINMSM